MKNQNKDIRYYVDLDVKDMKVVGWGYDQKQVLVDKQILDNPNHKRIFLTKGQYRKMTN